MFKTITRCCHVKDLCKHFKYRISATYSEGKTTGKLLSEIDNDQLKKSNISLEEAAKRDHRVIGQDQELFFFHKFSTRSCFFQPNGAHIYNTLINFLRIEYRKRGYQEVITPNIFNSQLWEMSGHWEHFADDMFSFKNGTETLALKPMNCPGHCLIFGHRPRSWRELPLRLADFGVLHRNENTGSLTGLTRVRRFQQDDAHIFCTTEQIRGEIDATLDFLKFVYGVFGFTFQLRLSTRPDNYLGNTEDWNFAEKQLTESLDSRCEKWTLNPGDGTFYGPKIDITLTDALERYHQCATIQLDFQLPVRFDLNYQSDTGDKVRPVIIHRAILGSVERMIAILAENFAGKWPFWLSPRQAMVVPLASKYYEYAQEVKSRIFNAGFMCDVDFESESFNKKIRKAQVAQYNFILVVGEREKMTEKVNVRTRNKKVLGELNVNEVIERFHRLSNDFVLKSEDNF